VEPEKLVAINTAMTTTTTAPPITNFVVGDTVSSSTVMRDPQNVIREP
jgi:hypothetical protein